MSFITLDFETYYANDLGFRTQTNEEYLNDPRFEVIGVGIKVDDNPTKWVTENIADELAMLDWGNSALLCHNMMFDGAILAWKYGIVPAMYYDTLCMARAIHGVDAGGSLKALAERYNLGVKGTEVVDALGKRKQDFTPEELAAYGHYCINDVNLTFKLFGSLLSGHFPQDELKLIDMTLRMYTQPVIEVDDALLVDRLEHVRAQKKELLSGLMDAMKVTTVEEVRACLASNPQFAAELERHGVTPPKKVSLTTGKETFALAKNDEAFIALQEHEDPIVQQLCAVRLGTKSTIEESRIERFIGIGSRNRGRLPIPLKYYGAHTGRWSGQDSVNLQNLPSRDKNKKALKNALLAPLGHYIINCDSSQIEARVLAWLAGQDEVVSQFANGEDVYSIFASKVFGFEVSKAHPVQRHIGKVATLSLGYGTGAKKLQHTLKTQPPGADLSEDECKRIVDLYRQENDKIPELWRECELALNHLMSWPPGTREYSLGQHEAVWVTPNGLRLPNGLYIKYPKLQRGEKGFVYTSRKGVQSLWGGAVVENVVQALARIIVGQQMIELAKQGLRPVLTVHDAAVVVTPQDELEQAMKLMIGVMSAPPEWAPGLPVACEAKYGRSYGDC
jgi:DNA polymerase